MYPSPVKKIKLAASLLLVSLCYKLVKHSSQLDSQTHPSQCLLQCTSTRPAEPPAKLVTSNKKSLQSSAYHITSMPFSAHFFLLLLGFLTQAASLQLFSSTVPGDSPVTTDDKVNLLYMTYSCCFSLHPGRAVIISLSGVMLGFWYLHCLACHQEMVPTVVTSSASLVCWTPKHWPPVLVGLVLGILQGNQQLSVS